MSTEPLFKGAASPLSNLVSAARFAIQLRRENDFRNLPLWTERHVMMKKSAKDTDEIIETATSCYGDMEFRGSTRSSRAKFLRLSDATDVKMIYNMMIKGWKMEQPRLLISVIGGMKSFSLDSDTTQHFTAGLSKIAQTQGTWVLSDGTNSGVAKRVGDAMQGCSKACIGIASWGGIINRDELEHKEDGKYIYHVGSWLTDEGVYLDSNHSHFLLIDDGEVGQMGAEVAFRHQLERHIMTESGEKVPSVRLVMEGDITTFAHVLSSVSCDMPIPIVLVKSSGGAADLLCYALALEKEVGIQTDLSSTLHQGLVSMITKTFPELEEDAERTKTVYRIILQIMQYKDMLTTSAYSSKEIDIDDAILAALLNDRDTSTFRQLQLTLAWGRADLAKAIIFDKRLSWEGDPKELQWLMVQALAMDNPDFVQLLLENGVTIKSFLTNEVLEFLYGYRSYKNVSPLGWEVKEKDYRPCNMSGSNAKIYEYLCENCGYDTQTIAIPRNVVEYIMNAIACHNLVKIGNEKFIEDLKVQSDESIDSHDEKGKTFKYPYRELFFWAIMNNMKSMALFLWQFEEQPMAKALIASEVAHVLYKRRRNVEHLEKSLAELMTLFKEKAVQVLNQCYKIDEQKSQQLMTSFFYQFPTVNTLTLAVNASNREFVSHSSVQVLLNDIWTGNMKMREVNMTEIILATLFPWRIKKFEFRTEEEIKKMAKADDIADESSPTSNASYFHLPKPAGTQLPLYKKVFQYYWYTPVVKFITHVIFYFIFLAIYSHFSMIDKKHDPDGVEYFLMVTVFAYGVAEVYQVMQVDAPTFKARVQDWASSRVNILDATIIITFFISLGFRISANYRFLGHLLYAIDCGLWILRLLNVFYINPTLGPYIVMICKMVKDVLIFMGVLWIILLSYGVTSAAILYPQDSANINMLRDPIWQPYFKIYGLNLVDREPKTNTTTRFGTERRTDYDETVVWILTGLYCLIVNTLLLNLLIAVMNNTYNAVQENSSQVWKYERYNLIMEYTQRHPLPPPFSLFGHTYLFIQWVQECIRGKRKQQYTGFKTDITNEEKDELLEFECNCVTQLSRQKECSGEKSFKEVSIHMRAEMEGVKLLVSSMEVRMAVENMQRVKEQKERDKEAKRISLANVSGLPATDT